MENQVVLQEAVKKLTSAAYRKKYRSLNSYATIKDGNVITYVNQACYAGLSSNCHGIDTLIALVDKAAYGDGDCSVGDHGHTFTRDELIKFYSYLARRSPWRTAFVDKNASTMVDESYSVMNINKPSNLVAGALTAQRQAWEYTQIVHTWLFLRKHQPQGNENWHFYLASLLRVKCIGGDNYSFTWCPQSHSHAPLNAAGMEKAQLENFINGKLVNLNAKLKTGESYRGIQTLFGAIPLRYGHEGFSGVLRDVLAGADLNLAERIFAWNKAFFRLDGGDNDVKHYPVADNLERLDRLYQLHFGGNE